MRQVLMALVLVAGCGAGSDQGNEAGRTKAGTVPITGLAGLYEGGTSIRPNQMCMIEREGEASFALVVWGANMHSCAGSGKAVREGDTVRLTMAGDETCAIEARISGATLTLPETLPQGCSYYCGAQAKMAGTSFAKKSSQVEDAMKAKDLVGEPLCGGMPSQ
jgi:hypothetical protein